MLSASPAEPGPQEYSDQVVVITGGAAGIGAECAEYFARAGAHVVLADRADSVHDAAAHLPGAGRHCGVVVDVRERASVAGLVTQLREHYDARVDVLVNCAGVALLAPAHELSDEQWETTIEINLTGTFRVARELGALMAKRGYGRIINLASQASVVALDRHAAYCASKAGVVGLTTVLAAEWAREGITVNSVSPTVVDTELGRRAWEGAPGEAMRAAIPVGRFARTDEIASLVGYLASEQAAMITGQNVVIDGGYTIV